MKRTLTKADPVGWYAVDYVKDYGVTKNTSFWWDGESLRHGETHPRFTQCMGDFTNFRLLVEAPAEYHTIHERAEKFLSEFASNPISDTIEVFSRHLREHTASLTGKISNLRNEADQSKVVFKSWQDEARFYEKQLGDAAEVATDHGWVPGTSLADWLRERLEPKPASVSDQHIGTQDTSDEIPGLGDGDDTWEEPSPEDRYEPTVDRTEAEEAVLKRVPDSPGEWHHCGGQILRVWESKPRPSFLPVLKGQYVDETRSSVSPGALIETFRTTIPSWVKAGPPVDANCEATKTLRELTTAIHAVCDEAEIPSHQPKMARAHLPEPVKVKDRLSQLKQKIISDHDDRTVFCCPECGGTYFGTENATLPFSQWVRQCHDQYGVGCRWQGKDKDCILNARGAAHLLSEFLAKRQWQLREIGRLVLPKNGVTLLEAVEALRNEKEDAVVSLGHSRRNTDLYRKLLHRTDGEFEDFRRRVIEAAKPEDPSDVIAVIKALRAQRDHLRETITKTSVLDRGWPLSFAAPCPGAAA